MWSRSVHCKCGAAWSPPPRTSCQRAVSARILAEGGGGGHRCGPWSGHSSGLVDCSPAFVNIYYYHAISQSRFFLWVGRGRDGNFPPDGPNELFP